MGTTTTNTTTAQTNAPWAPQQPYMTGAWQDAQNAYNTSLSNNLSTTPSQFVAPQSTAQNAAYSQQGAYGTNYTNANAQTSTGLTNLATGTGALSSAVNGLNSYNPAATNNMNANIAGANAYVQGTNIPAQVQQAMLSGEQTAQNVTLPQDLNTAAGQGGANNTREALSQGLVQQGLAEQASSLSGALQGQAYATGANLASNTNTVNNAAQLAALTGLTSAGGVGVAGGDQGVTSGIGNVGALSNIANTGYTGLQTGQQAIDQNQIQQNQFLTGQDYSSLMPYYQIVGQNVGSQENGTQTTQTSPSLLSSLSALAGGVGSLVGGVFGGNGLFGANGAFGSKGAFGTTSN